MPNRELLKQLEIEKQRRGINRSAGSAPGDFESTGPGLREHRLAWEYELEAYRAQQKKIRWLTVGALCGVLSLILELVLHWQDIAVLIPLAAAGT